MLREEITQCTKQQQQNRSKKTTTRHDPFFDSHVDYQHDKRLRHTINACKAVSHCLKPRLPLSSMATTTTTTPLADLVLSSSSMVDYMKLDYQYYLPYFLFTTRKEATVSQLEHFFFMWINASLKPKLFPIFWLWLSQAQRLFIRSRLHKRMRRCLFHSSSRNNDNVHMNLMRRHFRCHWYGMYPVPPTRRTRAIWKNKKTQPMMIPPDRQTTITSSSSSSSSSPSSSLPLPPAPVVLVPPPPSPPSLPPPPSRRRKNWMPPINSETVQELSIITIFKSIQLRHDLLFDPHLRFRPNLDGRSGREKCRKSQRYWRRVNHALHSLASGDNDDDDDDDDDDDNHSPCRLEFLRVILNELQKILVSLYAPFASTPASHEPWHWPSHISLDHFFSVFDVDFIIHQLHHGLVCLDPVIHLMLAIVTPLCPSSHLALLSSLERALLGHHFGTALRQCFSLLEVIKLDCANRILHLYRPYLLDTCPNIEFHCFKRQLDCGQIKLDSTYNWLRHHWIQQQQQHTKETINFYDVFHQGLIQLVATHQLDNQPSIRFPITLQFDERRLTQQLRQEFQSLMLISIVLIPYRYIAGPFATSSDMARLKRTCIDLCKDGAMAGDIFTFFGEGSKDGGDGHAVLQTGYRLAYKACHRAFQAHYRHHVLEKSSDAHRVVVPLLSMESLGADQLCQVSQFWANWLLALLKARDSTLYTLLHTRLCTSLCFIAQHGSSALANNAPMMATMQLMVGIQDTIVLLGEKLKTVADLNLATFGSIYKVLALDLLQTVV